MTLLLIPCTGAIFSSPATAQIKTPQRVSPCKASQLSAAEDRKESDELDGGVGNHAMTIAVQNRTSSACVLRGIPTVTFLDRANHPFPVQVCSNCPDYLFPSQPVKEILLESKKSAYLLVGYNINHGAGPCRNPIAFSLHLSGQREPLRGGLAGMLRSCGGVVITPFLEKPPREGYMFEVDPANPEK
jgi:hypothetical protein